MLSIHLDPETEKRLSALARLAGRSEDSCAKELIEEHIEDLEDRYIALRRLENREPPLTSQQVRKELGLEH
jgi:RHH-type rel operon transcriptional repressor/antitoxin RelB